MIIAAEGLRVPYSNFVIAMPAKAGVDGEIVDANGVCIAVVDHNREVPDEVVASISLFLASAINRAAAPYPAYQP